MRILIVLLITLAVSFNSSLSSENPSSIKEAISQFENDLRENKSSEKIKGDLDKILNLKKHFPVKHIPEVNYLLNKEIEKIPSTPLTNFSKISFFLLPLRNGALIVNFILCLLSTIYINQFLKIRGIYRLSLTLISTIILISIFILNFQPLILFISGITAGVIYKLGKKRISLLLLLTSILVLISQNTINFFSNLSQNPTYLYNLKIERDGYLPDYLIDKAIKEKNAIFLEKVTNNLALGDVSYIENLKELKLNEPKLRQIHLNDLGYTEFLKGNYAEALKYFKKALSIGENKYILYNLYLTYSSLLSIKKADEIKKKLNQNLNISNLPPVPLLIHVPVEVNFQIPSPVSLFLLLIGIPIGYFFSEKILQKKLEFNSKVASILWMKEFLRDRIKIFFLILSVSVFINLIMGILSCRN